MRCGKAVGVEEATVPLEGTGLPAGRPAERQRIDLAAHHVVDIIGATGTRASERVRLRLGGRRFGPASRAPHPNRQGLTHHSASVARHSPLIAVRRSLPISRCSLLITRYSSLIARCLPLIPTLWPGR